MERILYFDCFAGISGDMSVGALLDLGLDSKTVVEEIKKLGIGGYEIEISKTKRLSISGIDVKVILSEEPSCLHTHENDIHSGHTHHEHSHEETKEHNHIGKERSLSDIKHIITSSGINKNAKDLAVRIFTEIAKAEAVVHDKKVEDVHFHEVGAVDSIVDIVGAAICIDMLKVDKIFCSPVHEGKGFVNCRHGRLPIPVPAVMQMLKNSKIPVITEDIEAELVTPTGFGILKTVSESCGEMPEMLVENVGYGFGKTETGSLNALRVVLGTTSKLKDDSVILLETNIDNTTGEAMGYAMDRLFEAGALDVYYTPIYMKKNRPAFILSVICKKSDAEKLSDIIFRETFSIGIRVQDTRRITLDRNIKTVSTEFGDVRVKSVVVAGLERIQPEYEDCAKIAKDNNLSLNEVYEILKRR